MSILAVLGLLPPETRGESQAGTAALVALAALLTWREPSVGRGRSFLVLALALAIPIVRGALAPGPAVEALANGLLGAAAGLAAAAAVRTVGPSRGILLAPALGAGAVGLHAVYQKLWGLSALGEAVAETPAVPDRDLILARVAEGRSFAGFATPAALGGYLALILPLTIALARERRGVLARFLWAAAALQAAGLVCSESATAAGALLVVALVALAWTGGRASLRAVGLVVLAAAILGAVVWARGGAVLAPSSPDGPWRLRAGNLRVAWQITRDHPWKGVGPGGYAEAFPAYRRPGDAETRHAHDLPLELTAEWGVPAGGLLTVAFFTLFLGPLIRLRDARGPPWRIGIAIGLGAFAVQNLGDFTAFFPSVFWTACILRGLGARGPAAPLPALRGSVIPSVALAGTLVTAVLAGLSGAAWNERYAARLAVAAGDAGEASAHADLAARLAPWNVDGRMIRAETMLAASSLDGPALRAAAAEVDDAIDGSPVRPSARALRARIRLASGDAAGALADLTEAARLHPARTEYARRRDELEGRLREQIQGEDGS